MAGGWPVYWLAVFLLALTAVVVLVGAAAERDSRQVQAVVHAYVAAVEREDLQAALDTIQPDRRDEWSGFVMNLLGTRFNVRAVSIAAPSLLDRWFGGKPATATSATVLTDVNPGAPDAWEASVQVPVVRQGERFYLAEPPLAQ